MELHPSFRTRLKEALDSTGRNPAWLASELGVSPPTVYRWLKEEGFADPRPKTRTAVAEALGVSEAWLSGLSNERRTKPDPNDVLPTGDHLVLRNAARLLMRIANEKELASEADQTLAGEYATAAYALLRIATLPGN